MTDTPWKPDVCCFHGGCDDGNGAALAVWKRWGDDVQYVPCGYSKPIDADLTGKNVLFVDISLKREPMRELGRKAKSVIILDHHATARQELLEWGSERPPLSLGRALADAAFNLAHCEMQNALPILAYFDMDKSGARLAWEFCHPDMLIPQLILHIEDRDLWRFGLPDTHEISAALRSYPQEFRDWDRWLYYVEPLRREGGAILRAHEKNVAEFCKNVHVLAFSLPDGPVYEAPAVNVPYHYASDCADYLMRRMPSAPFAASYFIRGDGKRQFSLRSTNNRMDVGQLAQAYGGGGHRNAAGFELPGDATAVVGI